MNNEPDSTGALRRKLDGLCLEVAALEDHLERLRSRTELRWEYRRLGLTALLTMPLILSGLGAWMVLYYWLHLDNLFRTWFL